ncbi:MAG TPA: HAMP domain-containing sensor histidine kinase, partial [Isosphaeraceae bacterium]|nr:HAMP domain-containing sensor histidine kinase [Isosphaeraceae bacterium]
LRLHIRPGEEEFFQWIEPIVRSTQLLQVRLEHLMAAVRTGPPVLVELDLAPLICEATELFLKGTDPLGRKITIRMNLPENLPRVMGDGGRLIQVMLNLVSNAHEAILSARPVGHIDVTARETHEGDVHWVAIDVADDGPGISDVHLNRIFEPFFTTKDTGSGYGLYLASEIVREHGGRLTVCNGQAGGACFTIWLPAAQAAEPSRAGPVDVGLPGTS